MSRMKPALIAAAMLGALYGGSVELLKAPNPLDRPKPPEPPEPTPTRRSHQTHHGFYRSQVEAARKAISSSRKGRNKRKGKR